jgi:pilus assembly protein CpaF
MNENEMLTALGPLAPLMQEAAVTEIMVDAPDSVYVERKGKLEATDVRFDSPEAIRAVIDAVFALGGVTLGPGKTGHEMRLPDTSRFAAAIPPTAVSGPCLTIRKFFKTPLTMEKLFEFNAITREAHALLQSAIHAARNILVAGGTGSGKTTFLNILTAEIPVDERAIVVEEAFELQPRCPRVVRLAADSSPDMKVTDLIGLAAHMRPDRLIFGELHGAEVMRILEIISVGYDGTFMTMHADHPEDALARLEAMCLMANLGLGLAEIRRLIASTVNVIPVLQRLPNGSRKVAQITEVRGLEDDRYVLQPLMRYNPEADTFEMTGAKPSWEKS